MGTARERMVGLTLLVGLALMTGSLAAIEDTGTAYHDLCRAPVLQAVFVLVPSLAVAVTSARAYLRSGSSSIVLPGIGFPVSGVGSTVSVWSRDPDILLSLAPNGAVTVGNLGFLGGR